MNPRTTIIRDDRGYATIATAGIITAIAAVLLAVAGIASHVVARHQAQVAADLSAVAGAFAVATGQDGCSAARHTAELNSARLTNCRVDGRDVLATATNRTADATARAGPISGAPHSVAPAAT